MPSTATFKITGEIVGLPEGSESLSITVTNSTSIGTLTQFFIGTSGIAGATTVAVPVHSRFALIVGPGAAGTSSILRICNSTTATTANALAMHSSGIAFLPVISSGLGVSTASFTTLVFFTSGTVSTANPVRVSFY